MGFRRKLIHIVQKGLTGIGKMLMVYLSAANFIQGEI
jgi:hypothetical protein